jgi:drug/metabolite transporter (DMT)-like permease
VGIQETTAGKAGFITAMYMVLVPIGGLLLGKKTSPRLWAAVVVALAGLYLLCLSSGGLESLSRGDVLEMLCAVGFAVHILVIDHFSGQVDGVKMSCIQFLVCGILGLVGMCIWEQPSLSAVLAAGVPILYAGILSSGVGYTLQILAQKDTDPTVASLLMSLESVFSVIFGWLVLSQRMTPRELLGCLMIFAAIIWVQLPQKSQ